MDKYWGRIYFENFSSHLIEAYNDNPSSVLIFMFFMKENYLLRNGKIKKFKITDIAYKLNISRNRVYRALLSLIANDVICRHKNTYYYNPFIICPPNMSNTEISILQRRWEEYFGYYNYENELRKIQKDAPPKRGGSKEGEVCQEVNKELK